MSPKCTTARPCRDRDALDENCAGSALLFVRDGDGIALVNDDRRLVAYVLFCPFCGRKLGARRST